MIPAVSRRADEMAGGGAPSGSERSQRSPTARNDFQSGGDSLHLPSDSPHPTHPLESVIVSFVRSPAKNSVGLLSRWPHSSYPLAYRLTTARVSDRMKRLTETGLDELGKVA